MKERDERQEGIENELKNNLRKKVEELRAGDWTNLDQRSEGRSDRGIKKCNKDFWKNLLEGFAVRLRDLDVFGVESLLENKRQVEIQNEVLKELRVTKEEVEVFLEKIPADPEIRREVISGRQ